MEAKIARPGHLGVTYLWPSCSRPYALPGTAPGSCRRGFLSNTSFADGGRGPIRIIAWWPAGIMPWHWT